MPVQTKQPRKLTADMMPEEYMTRKVSRSVEQGLRSGSKATVSRVTFDYSANVAKCEGTVGRKRQHEFILFLQLGEEPTTVRKITERRISQAKRRRAKKVLDSISRPLNAKE